MMELLPYFRFLLLIPLWVLIVEDFRKREVSLLWLIVFTIFSVISSLIANGLSSMCTYMVSNLLMLLYLGVGIVFYLRIRRRRWINPVNSYIGPGDLIFLFALTPLFDLREYVLFLIVSFLFSLAWITVARMICRKIKTVPLIGTIGIVWSISILIEFFR